MRFDPEEIASHFPILQESPAGGPSLHYLDNAATAQVPDCVLAAMSTHDSRRRANVKRGIHRLAEAASEAYENARAQAAAYLGGVNADEVIFTGGTTAGINLLALSLGQRLGPGDEILSSQLEHHSNLLPWQLLAERRGVTLKFIPATADGALDLSRLDALLTPKTRLVALTHGSNVTAALTDVAAVVERARACGAQVMLDGAQTAAHGPVDLAALGVDFYVFSGHKVYGPSGVGVLWGRRELLEELPPAFGGGEMIRHVRLREATFAPPPHRFEAGTPPITQAVGLGAALRWVSGLGAAQVRAHLDTLTAAIMAGLVAIDNGRGRIKILGPPPGTLRLPLVAFDIAGAHPHDICQLMSDRYGVALRGGHHCAQPLHRHFGLDGSTRASLACFNRRADIDALLNGLSDCITVLC